MSDIHLRSLLLSVAIVLLLYIPVFPVGVWIPAPTGSMNPTMTGCDLVVYGPVHNPEIGDVAMYWNDENGLTMHRIHDIRGDRYIFKGDNMNEIDEERVQRSELQAQVYDVISTPVSMSLCKPIFRPTVNLYFDLVGYGGQTMGGRSS